MADQEVQGLIVKMQADLTEYQAALDKMASNTATTADKVSKSFASIGSAIEKLSVGLGALATSALNSAMNWGTAVDRISHTTGMATEEVSKFLVVAKRVGIDSDTAGMMMARLSMHINTSATEMSKANAEGKVSTDVLSRLGVSALNADGSMRSTGEIFGDIKTKLAGMQDGWQKTALEMQLFGRTGYQLNEMLSMSQTEYDKTIERAKTMGLVINEQTAAAWKNFSRDLNTAKSTLTTLGMAIGNEMLPHLRNMLDAVTKVTNAYVNMDSGTKNVTNSLISLIAQLAAARLGIQGIEWVIGASLPGWAKWVYYITLACIKLESMKQELASMPELTLAGYDDLGQPIFIPSRSVSQENMKKIKGDTNSQPPADTGVKTPDDFLGGGGADSKGTTPYQYAKQQYQQDVDILGSNSEQKLALWQQYCGEVQKTNAETTNYLNTLHALELADIKDKLETQKAFIDLAVAEHKKSAQDGLKAAITLAEQETEAVKKACGEQTKEYAEAKIKELELKKQAAQEDANILKTITEAKIKQDQNESDLEAQKIKHLYAMKQITNIQELQMLDANDTAIYNKKKTELDKELAAMVANGDQETDTYKKALQDRATLDAEYTKKHIDNADKLVEQQKRDLDQTKEAWATQLTDILDKTQTFSDLAKNIFKELINDLVRQMMGLQVSNSGLLGGLFNNMFGGLKVGSNAQGTNNWQGGLTSINEQGGEIVNLPSGTQIIPHDLSAQMVSSSSNSGGGSSGNPNVTINLSPTFHSLDPATGLQLMKQYIPQLQNEINNGIINSCRTQSSVRNALRGAT